MHTFWLVLTYDLLEDRRIDDVIIKTFFPVYFNSLLYKTSRFQVALGLFSNRSQRTSKCGKYIFCSWQVLTSSVIYYWTDPRQLEIYLLNVVIIELPPFLPVIYSIIHDLPEKNFFEITSS